MKQYYYDPDTVTIKEGKMENTLTIRDEDKVEVYDFKSGTVTITKPIKKEGK